MIKNLFFWVFILSFLMGGNVYAKNCIKGKACGNTCIARSKECHVGSGSSSNSSSDYSSPRRSSYSSPRRSRRNKSSNTYTPTASYTSPRRFSSSNTSEEQEEKKKSPVTISAVVSCVLNSDTLGTNKKGHKKISLYGIDAPEEDQPFGKEAKDFFRKKVFKKKIKEKVYDKKDDGTDIALVFAGGKNINELMIKAGYAWVYQPSCDESFCDDWVRYEEEAKAQKKGLWGGSGRIAPWIWR
ncbi:thermonuclease family protein [Desulfobulbus sp. US2]|nr:thermonuclease family protein [Desulfobulbus sp. US4]MCW5205044.1 thermonuclease family protein [Desulfobulbus sp. N2]MCW5207484.1 thermonuclease family protein [Desulfobulbus sp. US2]MCW5210481.1 thermonuclease family protein [Desulfobulbus sp. N3]MCW5214378.1 thermonuclease family protein [Desulfobulbus sp. US5]